MISIPLFQIEMDYLEIEEYFYLLLADLSREYFLEQQSNIL